MKDQLYKLIKDKGERFPKKHGWWYRIHVYGEHYLVLDTWNGHIYHHPNGAEPSDTNNMYRCVYVFRNNDGKEQRKSLKGNGFRFFYGHLSHLRLRSEP